jgi:hypothetical protein
MKQTEQRMLWVLRRIQSHKGWVMAWDEEVVDDFCEAFPEAKKTLIYYMLGANSSPMLNRAAGRAKKLGFLTAGHVGTDGARDCNQRTWCRTWTLTGRGEDYISDVDGKVA